jgi:hypothetical protein
VFLKANTVYRGQEGLEAITQWAKFHPIWKSLISAETVWPIFGEKNLAFFRENQCYDPINALLLKNAMFSNHNIGP